LDVLIIEDNIVYSKTIKNRLENQLVFVRCDVVRSFEELKKAYKNKKYDLFICDLFLPDAKGEQIDFLIKNSEKVILMTGYEEFELADELKNSILDYIIKDDISTIDYLVNFIRRLHKNPHVNILVVDDSKPVREYEKNILSKMFFNVFSAKNGKEALKIFESNDIDLVITDLVMEEMDGLSLIKKIRHSKKMTELPVIAISSSEEKKIFLKSLKLGANDYLKKPFEKEELVLRVNNLLDLYENYKKIQEKLIIDPLTEVYNRFYLENVLEKVFNNYEKKSIAMLDIDYFKNLNDTYGHQFGDEVLKYFAKTIKNNVRKSDIVVRYGGEEFLIFMPNTTKKEAFIVLLKIVKDLQPYKDIKFTFSAGIADEGETLAEMIKKADSRLYEAKESGRNKIVI